MPHLLTVGAHPDDASIFWGGTVAKHADEGWTVTSVTVDDGRGAPHSFPATPDELAARRAVELQREADRLGARNVHLALPGVKTPETRARCLDALAEVIGETRPRRVIMHHLADKHPTHVLVARLTVTALARAVETLADFPAPEVWQADGWEPVHYPDVRVDVTAYMNHKIGAIAQHGSQLYDTQYILGAVGLCAYRAGFAASHEVTDPACLYAEAYKRIPPEEVAGVAAEHAFEE